MEGSRQHSLLTAKLGQEKQAELKICNWPGCNRSATKNIIGNGAIECTCNQDDDTCLSFFLYYYNIKKALFHMYLYAFLKESVFALFPH